MNDNSLIKTGDWNRLPAVPSATIYAADVRPQPGSVLDYWGLLWRRKLLFAACTITGLAVALGVLFSQAPVYRAHTSLEIQNLNQNFVDMKLISPVADPTSVDALTDIQTQIKILQSDTLVGLALKDAGINSISDINPNRGNANWADIFHPDGNRTPQETLTETAGKNLKVAVAPQTRIVEISFDAPRPELAARFANALTAEFIEQNSHARWQMNRQTSDWLAGQLSELRAKLESSQHALEAYARKQSLIYTGDKRPLSEEKLRQLQAELSKAQAERVEKQSRFEIARSASPQTLPDVLNDSSLRALETTLTDLRRKQAEMEVTFTPDYSKAKKLRAESESLEEAIAQKRAEIVSRITNELTEAQRREELFSTAYADQTLRVTSDSEKSIQYDGLKREVDTNQQIYEAMLQRVKESTIAAAVKASNVRIVDPAMPPLHPYKPNFPMGSVAGLLCGSMFGLLAIVFRARTDVSVQEPGDAGSLLGIPELGVIPRSPAPSIVTMIPGIKHQRNPARLISSGNSLAADSFRAVLASIILAAEKNGPRVLVVTSANSGEGKTTATVNLATTLAKMNRKVLLIDGDIRNPHVHQIFELNNSLAVTDLLNSTGRSDTRIDQAIQAALPNLYVLTAGPEVEAGADLLFSSAIARLIDRYREQFDMVLIDTPPMLSMADARVLGRIADGVVLIARAGRTSRAAIQAAFRRLVDDQSNVLGIILNDWDTKSSPYKYYSSYRYAAASTSPKPSDAAAS